MKKVTIFFLLGILLAGCSSTRIKHIVAFGDDLSDTGNCHKFLKEYADQGKMSADDLIIWTQFWENRLSNGPVAVEVMADRLKVGLTDYAVCAATSGQDNLNTDIDVLDNTGLLGQVDKFESDLNGKKADVGSLYFIEASADDIAFKIPQNVKAIQDVADQAIINIATAITRLAKMGAKRFMVGNSSDLSIEPGVIDYYEVVKVFQTYFNSTLPGKMESLAKQLSIQIEIFDYIAVSDRIRANSQQYGLTNLTDPCTQLPDYRVNVCAKPDEYYFYGLYYMSRRVHQIMGEAMADQISK